MILLFHIFVALTSVILTGITSFFPSKKKLQTSYGLVGLTLASGTYLIITRPAHMVTTCIEGLIYIGVVSAGLLLARYKLAKVVEK